jgi:hypothetical protein
LWVRVPRLPLTKGRGHRPTGRRQHGMLEIRVRLPVTPLADTRSRGPTAHDAWPTPRKRWFDSIRDHLKRKGEGGRWKAEFIQTVRQRVVSPFLLPNSPFFQVLVEQPGVLACLSRKRSRVQIPPGTLGTVSIFISAKNGTAPLDTEDATARYANRKSGQAQTLVSAGSTPACATY